MPGPAYHGWTHHPTKGTDPIDLPPATGGGTPNLTNYKAHGLELLYLVRNGYWSGVTNWDFKTVESTVPGSTATVSSASAPFGGYFELVGQNSYVLLGFPLAPRYSVWKFDVILGIGSDCGIVSCEWQTVPASFGPGSDTYNATYSQIFEEKGQRPTDPTSDTNWYRSGTPISRYQYDCYNATSGVVNTDGGLAPDLWVTGAPGDLLSANPTGTPIPYTDTQDWVGAADGSMWWWARLKTKTKFASSSGYTMRLHGYNMHRHVADLKYPG